FGKETWKLIRDYWQSNDKWKAKGLLILIIALNLGDVYILVLLNSWNNTFYNALQKYDKTVFLHALGYFTVLAGVYIVISVYEQYFQQVLEIGWRRWMTDHYVRHWLSGQNYYRLQLLHNKTDNPDQRISEDIKMFVSTTLNLAIGCLKAVVTLGSFVVILWQLSGTLPIILGGHLWKISGYMVWTALAYAVMGTWLAAKIGRPLVRLNFDQQHYEADFRFSLVRFRENSESIAFYRGEKHEQHVFEERFQNVFANFWALMKRQKRLTWLTSGYSQLAVIFPFLVAAPRYFSRQIQLGGLVQIASAFGRVQDSLSYFVNSYSSIAEWQAVRDRLLDFRNHIEGMELISGKTMISRKYNRNSGFSVSEMTIRRPDGEALIEQLDFELNSGENLLITGPSGSGKSTLIRTLAGIWPFANGRLNWPQNEGILFLPQKPYLPLGSLREVLLYPQMSGFVTDKVLKEFMNDCKLNAFVARLDASENWSQVLSLGEQQRIAFVRALLQGPEWLFLDEATSALDEPTEGFLYQQIHDRLKNTTIISIGHRQTLNRYHQSRLHIWGMGKWTFEKGIDTLNSLSLSLLGMEH
ncbi:MAG TPA: ABC transporter ATP-binding protein, partial [Firmicutes bacterium]|nr:ABC transporter ATP-binding protein [Bacillota bacterium]